MLGVLQLDCKQWMDCNLHNRIYETKEYLETFLRNLLLNEHNVLSNRQLHISGLWNREKVDIEAEKVDIEAEKVDIGDLILEKTKDFNAKTMNHIRKMFDTFGFDIVFGRSAVEELLGLHHSGASKLISKLVNAEIIIPVAGQGKGKYRFLKS